MTFSRAGMVFLCLMSVACGPAPEAAPAGGKLLFEDTFTSKTLERYHTRYEWGDRWIKQGEQEYYGDPQIGQQGPFAFTDDGLEIIASVLPDAMRAGLSGQKYLSGLLTTYPSFAHRYGYFELCAKLPAGRGLWPAFWLLPFPYNLAEAPEIDVMEMLGNDPKSFYATVHWLSGRRKLLHKQFKVATPDLSADFHRYGLLWTATKLAWYFDGLEVGSTPTPSSLDQPMYLLVNLAVGGNWPGSPDATTAFPAKLILVSLRVYVVETP